MSADPPALWLLSDARMLEHEPGLTHAERPARLAAVLRQLRERPLPGAAWRAPTPAPRAALERAHRPDYVTELLALRGAHAELDPDTFTSPGSVDAALLAAGAAVDAVDAVVAGPTRQAFALVRPPGHHAERAAAMGFCLFNNAVVAVQHARAQHGLRRVLVVDWDVHHGNGTQHAFEEDPEVLFFSTHRFPFYPGTGAVHERGRGAGLGSTVNVPLPAGAGDHALELAFEALLLPLAERHRPELVVVSAGFDAHRDDPLADMRATAEGFARLCALVQGIAQRHAQGRLVLLLEGGYHLDNLARSVAACAQVLTGATLPERPAAGLGEAEVRQALRVHLGG